MKVNEISENRGMEAMKADSSIAAENGIDDMALDEINAEISDEPWDGIWSTKWNAKEFYPLDNALPQW